MYINASTYIYVCMYDGNGLVKLKHVQLVDRSILCGVCRFVSPLVSWQFHKSLWVVRLGWIGLALRSVTEKWPTCNWSKSHPVMRIHRVPHMYVHMNVTAIRWFCEISIFSDRNASMTCLIRRNAKFCPTRYSGCCDCYLQAKLPECIHTNVHMKLHTSTLACFEVLTRCDNNRCKIHM